MDFLIPIGVGIIIQLLKVIIDYIDEKKVDWHHLLTAGGFPSVHSAIATSITTLMLLKHGLASSEFAIALSFSLLFWYDAVNVRYEAGKHAKFINRIHEELKDVMKLTQHPTLKERLGHTTVELYGGIFFGAVLTILIFNLIS